MYTLALNLRATKRLYFHQVIDPVGEVAFTSKHADECFHWLYEQGQHEFWLMGQGPTYHVTITKRTA